jgi:PKD repeat protein
VSNRVARPLRTPAGLLFGVLCLLSATPARAWVDAAWPYRRPVDVAWDPTMASGEELALVDFYSAGHCLPDASDVRVATEDNRFVSSHVLMAGPGDRVRVVFTLAKTATRYYVYFGNPKPPAPKAGLEDVKYDRGLLAEMRGWTSGGVDNFKQVEEAWAKAQPVLGRTILDKPFLGYNPFGPEEKTILKLTGVLTAPSDGEYGFAMSADDRAALYLDGQPVLFVAQQVGDVRLNAKHTLARGEHAFLLYHVNTGGPMSLSAAWLPAGMKLWEPLDRNAFGSPFRGADGPLEELHKTLTADFSVARQGECFFANGYSQRYAFAAHPPKVAARASYAWDFGDGQAATGAEVQHIYLVDGVYPVKLTVRAGAGANGDTQTIKLAVSRDWEHLTGVRQDDPAIHARVAAGYDLSREPEQWWPREGWLQLKVGNVAAMLAACDKVAAGKKHADPAGAMDLLAEAVAEAASKGQADAALKLWEAVPADSDLQPAATGRYARMLLWRAGDFARAAAVLRPFVGGGASNNDLKDPTLLPLRRTYAEALLLGQKTDEAKKLLAALPAQGDPAHQAAISGASARTVEYYITQGDWEAGEDAWDVWQARYPSDFLQGYSVLLKTKLMELKKAPEAAARVAEAFATAVPTSSYSPQLLDRASKLMAATDPGKSQALRKMLKERYPEDPLSQ